MTETEIEAVATLRAQLLGEQGFLARLQQGNGLDRRGVEAVYGALDTLAVYWADRTEVPKAALLPLVDVDGSLFACAGQHPDLAETLERLARDLTYHVEVVVLGASPGLSYEQAAAIVFTHFSGLPSVAQSLHHREQLDGEWSAEVLQALNVLALAWSTRSDVPRAIAGSMLGAGDLIRGHAGNYPPTQQRELEAIADECVVRIRRCLQDQAR